jgi:hypothetical protein
VGRGVMCEEDIAVSVCHCVCMCGWHGGGGWVVVADITEAAPLSCHA